MKKLINYIKECRNKLSLLRLSNIYMKLYLTGGMAKDEEHYANFALDILSRV